MPRMQAIQRKRYFSDPRARVVVHREVRQLPMSQHRHEFFEIVLILSGSGIHLTGDFRHRLESGDVLVIDPRRSHGYEDTRGLNLVNILVRADLLPRIARDLGGLPGFHALFTLATVRWQRSSYSSRLRLSAADMQQAGTWTDQLEEESHRGDQGGHLLAEAYLTLIVGLLARRYARGVPRREERSGNRLGRLLGWIECHLAEPITVERLAAEAGMSVRSFHRHFRDGVEESPTAYVLRQRIRRATEILRAEPATGMVEVASRCGWDDPNYFSRIFRRHMGCSPSQYRSGTMQLNSCEARRTHLVAVAEMQSP
jgi:AraC-like DNA-binding protein